MKKTETLATRLQKNTILTGEELKVRPDVVLLAQQVAKKQKAYEKVGVTYEMLRTFLLEPKLDASVLDQDVLERVATLFSPEVVKKEIRSRWCKDDKNRRTFVTADSVEKNLGSIYLMPGLYEMESNRFEEKVLNNIDAFTTADDVNTKWYTLCGELEFERVDYESDFWTKDELLWVEFVRSAGAKDLDKKRFLQRFAPQTWKRLEEHQQYIDFVKNMPICLAREDLMKWRADVHAVEKHLMTMEMSKKGQDIYGATFEETRNEWENSETVPVIPYKKTQNTY
ncbi:MAG: hypothetical protein II942_04140 [Alphaproteobacteria bacterium]|nr:hypothetical protein [Alphaproteobacteria bacterium]